MEFYVNEEPGILRRIVTWVTDIIVVIAFACFTVYGFGTQIPVSGSSMQPLLNNGDVVLMNRLLYDFTAPERGDIVVFQREDQKLNVKRVNGLPGETVQIRNGQIYIDGEVLPEEENFFVASAGLAESPVLLGEDEYFLLGDNRDSSEDSRFANVGNVKKSQIIGKVWLKIAPILEIGLIE